VEHANQSLEKLKADIANESKVSTPLLNGENAELSRDVGVQSVVAAIQAYMKKSDVPLDKVFAKVSKKKEASKDDFSAFLDTLSDPSGKDSISLTQDQAAEVFTAFGASGGKLKAASFQAACKECCVCTMAVALMSDLQEGTETTVVEVGEAIVVDERKKDAKGNTHGYCTLKRDGAKGWVLMQTADGSSSFKPSPHGASFLESVVAYVTEVNTRCKEAAEAVEQKALEVSSVKQGPLAEVKSKLLELKLKLSQ
jgi:hypothetical protein